MKTSEDLARVLAEMALEQAAYSGALLTLSIIVRSERRAPTIKELCTLFEGDPELQAKLGKIVGVRH